MSFPRSMQSTSKSGGRTESARPARRCAGGLVTPRGAAAVVQGLEGRTLLAAFVVANLDPAGPGSLAAAVEMANRAPGADVVCFAAGVTGMVTLAAQLSITDPLTIDGPGADRLTLSGGSVTRVMDVTPTAVKVTIRNLTIADGVATDVTAGRGTDARLALGGGIRNAGALLSLSDVGLVNNQAVAPDAAAGAGGGAVANVFGATLTVSRVTFTGNRAVAHPAGVVDSAGGAIYNEVNSVLSVSASTFTGNQAVGGGHFGGFAGAIYNCLGSRAELVDCAFTANVARGTDGGAGGPSGPGGWATGGRGGAIATGSIGILAPAAGSSLTALRCTFVGNVAVGGRGGDGGPGSYGGLGGKALGGAIVTSGQDSVTTVTSGRFVGNKAIGGRGGDGGAGWNSLYGGDAMGGALDLGSATLVVVDSTFDGNEAVAGDSGDGGAGGSALGGGDALGGAISTSVLTMTMDVPSALDVQRCTFTSNLARGGAAGDGHFGGYNSGGIAQGGGISVQFGTGRIDRSRFIANRAIGGDGGQAHDAGGTGGMGIGGGVLVGYPGSTQSDGVTRSVFEDNLALGGAGGAGGAGGRAIGGGVGNGAGTIAIGQCTLSGNVALGGPGGVGASGGDAQGGGFMNVGVATVAKTIITRNRAVGGLAGPGGTAGLGIGGGIFNSGSIVVGDPGLISGNDADLFDDCYGC